MSEVNMILYHCNDSFRCGNFIRHNEFIIIDEEDTKWLGKGMYFWDNLGNAKFWKKKKYKDNLYKEYSIVKANVYLNNLLDLTDINICNKIADIWDHTRTKLGEEDTELLGVKLNLLFNKVPGFADKYYIIKIIGKYYKTPQNKLFSYDTKKDITEPVLSVKCIYSVKRFDIIYNREKIE